MALIKCAECGELISDKASACIHCGYSLGKEEKETQQEIVTPKKKSNNILDIAIAIVLSLIIMIISILFLNNIKISLLFGLGVGAIYLFKQFKK